jgi:hypothetical protein
LTRHRTASKIEAVTERWTQLIIGAWVLVSPWLLGFSSISIMKWSNMLCGLALILINVWLMYGKSSAVKDENVVNRERSQK